MGSINFSAATLFGSLSDVVGVKSGLALSKARILKIFADHDRHLDLVDADDDSWVRVHSVTYEEMVELLLFAVGRLERLNNLPGMPSLRQKFGHDADTMKVISGIGDLYIAWMEGLNLDSIPRGTLIDPSDFMKAATRKFGRLGLDMCVHFLHAQSVQQMLKSVHFMEMQPDDDTISLDELFSSEGLPHEKGRFFDQRFIDYLARNFEEIDRINWRQFEGLTAEYFTRSGFAVELGAGRNDDGIDVRVWPIGDDASKPPAIIIQCKRQKAKISKVVVKSLYADVLNQSATSGLVVTTSYLSPGARNVCQARKYPILDAERDQVREWVAEMRKPGMGVIT